MVGESETSYKENEELSYFCSKHLSSGGISAAAKHAYEFCKTFFSSEVLESRWLCRCISFFAQLSHSTSRLSAKSSKVRRGKGMEITP